MSKLKETRGFTLIEVMVVIVIMAVLMAIAVPSVMKYLSTGDEAKALDEAYACVSAADYYGTRAYTKGTEPNLIKKDALLKKANVDGYIRDFWFVNYKVIRLVYKASNGQTIVFDHDQYYFNPEVGDLTLNTYIDKLFQVHIKNDLEKMTDGTKKVQKLQKVYLEENQNAYPKLTDEEIEMLTSHNFSLEEAKKLSWKPNYDASGSIYLVADIKASTGELVGATQGPLIFFLGKYYYHKHSPEQPNKASVDWIKEGELDNVLLKTEWAEIK